MTIFFFFFSVYFPFPLFSLKRWGVGGLQAGGGGVRCLQSRGEGRGVLVGWGGLQASNGKEGFPTPRQGTRKIGRGNDREGCRLVTAARES